MIMPNRRRSGEFPYNEGQVADASQVLLDYYVRPAMARLLDGIPRHPNAVVRLVMIDALTELVTQHLPLLELEDFSRLAKWLDRSRREERDPSCRRAARELLRRLDDWIDQ